jgi:hypothetical protein
VTGGAVRIGFDTTKDETCMPHKIINLGALTYCRLNWC